GEGELDTATLGAAVVVVETRAAALGAPPSGAVDLRRAVAAGALAPHGIAELGEVAAGRAAGRTSDEQITVYPSVGVAVQDAAGAALVLDAARRAGAGVTVEL